MAENKKELSFIFKNIIEKGIYHFEIVLRDYDTLETQVVGWAIINTKNNISSFNTSKCLEKFVTHNDINAFIKEMSDCAKELDKAIFYFSGGPVHD